jgi:hypothetical protein
MMHGRKKHQNSNSLVYRINVPEHKHVRLTGNGLIIAGREL